MSKVNDKSTWIPLISYISKRLKQFNVEHIFGLPGDYELAVVADFVQQEGFTWVSNANELNAAYAVDTYARTPEHKLGVILTTYGVGELSAINGIAGSFAESSPVLHIVGAPNTELTSKGVNVHHSLMDRSYNKFAKMYDYVTCKSLYIKKKDALHPGELVSKIDDLIREIITQSKPGYLAIPTNFRDLLVPSSGLSEPITLPKSDEHTYERFKNDLREIIKDSVRDGKKLTALVGMLVSRRNVREMLDKIADSNKVNLAFQPNARTAISQKHPNYVGVYVSKCTRDDSTRELVDSAQPIFLIGTVLGEFNTGLYSHGFDELSAVEFGLNSARIGVVYYNNLALEQSLAIFYELLAELADLADPEILSSKVDNSEKIANLPISNRKLNQTSFWEIIEHFFWGSEEDYTVIFETGTGSFASVGIKEVPENAEVFGQMQYGSIGWGLPATLGVGLGNPDKRPLLITGDGAAQLTVQELSVMSRHKLNPIVVLNNNNGYTIERVFGHPTEMWHDIASWDWNRLAESLMPSVKTYDCHTDEEFLSALKTAESDDSCPHFINVRLPENSLPSTMHKFFDNVISDDVRAYLD